MRRRHLIELEDEAWCPMPIRDGVTALEGSALLLGNLYAPIIPHLAAALRKTGEHEIVDLCSGSGGPWLRLLPFFPKTELTCVRLTDKYPNVASFRHAVARGNGRVIADMESVDATAFPSHLRGFRTMFTSLHHFRPEVARAILADAVQNRAGIGVFEFTERSVFALVLVSLGSLAIFLLTPFVRPFRWSHLLLTYLLPILPCAGFLDGIVTCLRTYSPDELHTLVRELDTDEYIWEIGQERRWRFMVPVTFLIGYPAHNDTPTA